MAYYLFYQAEGQSVWIPALADQREAVLAKAPPFTTVLDVDHSFSPDPSDKYACHYRGPFYLDLDAANIEDVIVDAKSTLENFERMDVDLNTIEIFVSGGKGYHFVVPMPVFVDKMPRSGGYTKLPLIYRDMAMENFRCDSLDMRVYSLGRGRMWRTPNIKRDNGLHKVRVTPQEVWDMTPESYRTIASAPRYPAPPAEAKSPAVGLATAFASAVDVVATRYKSTLKTRVDTDELRKRYEGKFPKTLVRLLSGDVRSEAGFQAIALQVAITASALGKTLDETLTESEGLLQKHVGDSSRYGSYNKRRTALRQAVQYIEDNPTYQFSMAAIRNLLPEDARKEEEAGEDPSTLGRAISQGIFFTQAGITHTKDEASVEVSKLGFDNISMMMDIRSHGRVIGYQTDIYHHGVRIGSELLEVGHLQSKQRFQAFASAYSAAVHCTDAQVVALMELFKQKAETEGTIVYATPREGLDLIKPEGATSTDDFDIAWISRDVTRSKKGHAYVVRSEDQEFGIYRSDLLSAGHLDGSEAEAEVISALLQVNTPYVVGAMLGWFAAAHTRMIFDHFYGQFPLLQVFGQAGAGKSKTVDLMLRLHYYMADPKITSSADITMHALQAACSASASIPAVFDEYKVREILKSRVDMLRRMFKNAYTRAGISKGFIDHDSGQSKVALRNMNFNAPVCFIGEAIESQTAILERSVVVNLTKDGRVGRKHHFDKAFNPDSRAVVSRLGQSIVDHILDGDWTRLKRVHEANRAEVDNAWGDIANDGDDRQRFNTAVVLTGLSYIRAILGKVYPGRFDEAVAGLKEAVLHDSSSRTLSVVRKVQSELAKVLGTLSYLSNDPPREDLRVQVGKDYTLEGTALDIKAQSCFDKYRTYCKHVNQEPMYDSFDAFVTALETYDGTVKGAGGDNMVLRDGPRTKVFRLKLERLANEDVDSFRGQ